MILEAGARFGPYELAARLGTGGMGEVWRARDVRLDLEVALKLVGGPLAADPERLSRFEREAKLLAALHHPNIALPYGVEESEGLRALVLELVRGATLAERLATGAMPVQDALVVALQVAETLEHAHRYAIVHRDLRPANVKLTPDDEVKVLGFGLGEPSPSRGRAASGAVLCTAPYLSPEQARGQAADRAADIWAFGVILYEMLTGTQRFRGDTASDVREAVLRSEVEWDRLPGATPPAAARLLRRCLERDPRERLHDFASARIELTQALRELVSSRSPHSRGEARRPRPWPGGSSSWRQRSWPWLSRRADR